jgi:uncharacterized protein
MQYKKLGKTDYNASILGFGCMRLPFFEDPKAQNSFRANTNVDEEKAIEMFNYAIDHGINYFDTAYMYHGGNSEKVLGKAINGRRDKLIITTKSPMMAINKKEDFNRILDEQLEKLGTDYLNFYFLHGLNKKSWAKAQELDALKFLDSVLKDGRIKYAGFSFHDDLDTFQEIIDSYDWTMCQIQYNFYDENYQAGNKGLKYAHSKGIAVVIMEPLRGGRLTDKVPAEVQEIWDSAPVKRSPAEWCLRWVWNQPEVSLLLSGMSAMDQLVENVQIAETAAPNSLMPEELETIGQVVETYRRLMKVPCTGCGYCIPCPNEVNIPGIFSVYNDSYLFGDM